MEYVDSQGNIQDISDPELLKMAAGSFGLLGITVSLTLRMDKMSYARWGPQIIDLPMEEYLPRPDQALPADLKDSFENHYYAEWIAYPSHHLGSSFVFVITTYVSGQCWQSATLLPISCKSEIGRTLSQLG